MRKKSLRVWAALVPISVGFAIGTPACGSVDPNLFTPSGAGAGGVESTHVAGGSGAAAVGPTGPSDAGARQHETGAGGANQAGASGSVNAVSRGGTADQGGTAPTAGGTNSASVGGGVANTGGSTAAGTGALAGGTGTGGMSGAGTGDAGTGTGAAGNSGAGTNGGMNGAGISGAGTSGGMSRGGASNNAGAGGSGAPNAGNAGLCRSCDTVHSLLASCTLDDGCVYAGCVAGFVDCTTTAPNLNGCACRGNACCEGRCQTAHDNGVGDKFYDCEALQTYTAEQALAAADADTAQPGTASDQWRCGTDRDGSTGVCKTSTDGKTGSCTCWVYTGTGADIDQAGRVRVSNTGGCLCPTATSPTWN